jgi:hypothetical protein
VIFAFRAAANGSSRAIVALGGAVNDPTRAIVAF